MTGFGRILEDLNGAGVRYVLIGGIALIRHGVVRATRAVDAVFDSDPANVERIRALIERWGATRPDGSPYQAMGLLEIGASTSRLRMVISTCCPKARRRLTSATSWSGQRRAALKGSRRRSARLPISSLSSAWRGGSGTSST